MILLDQEDVVRLDLWKYPFYRRWDVEDPAQVDEAIALGWPDVLADGPFLLVVHDEDAWAGQEIDSLYNVAGRRTDRPNHKWWMALADLYADGMGISRQSLLLRFASASRYLRGDRLGQWCPWEKAYHWPDKDDLAWSSLVYGRHPWIEVRENDGRQEVMHRATPR
jgi:hypothetical protein